MVYKKIAYLCGRNAEYGNSRTISEYDRKNDHLLSAIFLECSSPGTRDYRQRHSAGSLLLGATWYQSSFDYADINLSEV